MMYWLTSLNDGLHILDLASNKTYKVLDSPCFGICEGTKRTFLFTIENANLRMCSIPQGKLLSFIYDKNTGLKDIVIEASGLDNGTHQICVRDNVIYIQETYCQTIKTFNLDENEHVIESSCKKFFPFGENVLNYHYLDEGSYIKSDEEKSYECQRHHLYRHMNAMLVREKCIYVLSPYLGRQKVCERKHPCIATLSVDMNDYINETLLPTTAIPHDLIEHNDEVVYVNSDLEIIHFNMNKNEPVKRVTFERDGARTKWMRGLCIHDNKYIVGCGKTIQILSMAGEVKLKMCVDVFTCVIQCVKERNNKKKATSTHNLTIWSPIQKITRFSPHVRVPFSMSRLDLCLLDNFQKDILDFDEFVMELNKTANIEAKSAGTGINYFCLTTAHHTYNLFSWNGNKFIEELKRQVLQEAKSLWDAMKSKDDSDHFPAKLYGKCWANILRSKGETLKRHVHKVHDHCFLTGHVTIQSSQTKTFYEYPFFDHMTYNVPNEIGKMIIFPSYLYHWTTPQIDERPRITLGFDLLLEEGLKKDKYGEMYVEITQSHASDK